MDIRPYTPADRDACLTLFDSNAPTLLPASGRPAYAAFLDADGRAYFVAEADGEIVGGGGFTMEGGCARLQWGIVHRKWQRQGLGRFLLFYRLREITRRAEVQMVSLQSPRLAAPFFVNQGFREVSGDGEHAELVKRLVVCSEPK